MVQTFTTATGVPIVIRPLLPTEGEQLLDLAVHLSSDTRYQRFHVALNPANREQVQHLLDQLLDVDQVDRIALAAVKTDDAGREEFLAVARAHRAAGAEEAEAAVVVRDDFQNQGLGLFMLRCLVEETRRAGFLRLRGFVQPNNTHLFHLLQKLGLHFQVQLGHGEATVVVFLQPEPVPA